MRSLIGVGIGAMFGGSGGGIPADNLAARFDASLGITSSGGFASQWNDLSGNARHLLQATGANQPIHLDFSGTKYAANFGVNANGFSTTDSAANSPTSDLALVFKLALRDWTPSASQIICIKATGAGANPRSFAFYVSGAGGVLVYSQSANGTTWVRDNVASIAPTVSDGADLWVAVSHDVDNGAGGNDLKFWTSSDGATWAQLGTTSTQAGTTSIADTNASVYVGYNADGTLPVNGKIYYGAIYKGIPPMLGGSGSATPSQVFDPSLWSSGSTWTGSGGETWTINSTGSKPAQIVDRASLLFDGAAHFMQAAFTLNQPASYYLVAKQISWTLGDHIANSVSANTGLFQSATTPRVRPYAGVVGAENSNWAVGAAAVVHWQLNGANSLTQINNTGAATGDAGSQNMGGFTLSARNDGTLHSNIQAYEALIYNVAHDAATRANVIRALMSKHGVA